MVAEVQQIYDIQVTWLPFFLRPDTPAEGRPLPEEIRRKRELYGSHLLQRAAAYGLPITYGDWEYSSRRALEASEYAREQGAHNTFHEIVFRKYFGEGQALSDWDMLRAAALEAGLDGDEMQEKTESGRYKEVVEGHYYQAHRLGITSIPTYIVGNRFAIVGAQPVEVFKTAIERLGVPPSPAAS